MNILEHQVILLSGPTDSATDSIEKLLQNALCEQHHESASGYASCFCTPCRLIKEHTHPGVVHLTPSRGYTLEDLEQIFERARLARRTHDRQIFIIHQAELLHDAPANKLLKILEEPAPNNFFILQTINSNLIIPTIKSRCVHYQLAGTADTLHPDHQPLVDLFFNAYDPIALEDFLASSSINEHETLKLVEHLIDRLEQERARALIHNRSTPRLDDQILYLMDWLLIPPQPGSADLFWKNVYLSYPRS